MKKTIVFTDSDLDGSMSYLLLDWCTTTKLPYKTTTVTRFHDDFTAWSRKNDVASYDNIYILDLDVSQKSLDLVDRPNITIIDHHTTHVENKHKYKNAKVYVTKYPSCAKLVYKLFKKKLDNVVNGNKKKLLLLVDDYDSWTHKYPQSKQLNYIYWNYQSDRLQAFVKDFQFGFIGFTPDQTNIVKFYENKLKKTITNLSYHRAVISIQKQDVKCVCTFADTLISDIGNHLIDIGYDIGFVVNLSSNRVSVRKNKSCNIDLGKLSKWLIDGGGHECAAGGMCTDKFLQFSKLFSPTTNGTR